MLSCMDSVQGKCSRLMKKGKERLEKDSAKSKENRPGVLRDPGSDGKRLQYKKAEEEWAESDMKEDNE